MTPSDKTYLDRFIEEADTLLTRLNDKVNELETRAALSDRDGESLRSDIDELRSDIKELQEWRRVAEPVVDSVSEQRAHGWKFVWGVLGVIASIIVGAVLKDVIGGE